MKKRGRTRQIRTRAAALLLAFALLLGLAACGQETGTAEPAEPGTEAGLPAGLVTEAGTEPGPEAEPLDNRGGGIGHQGKPTEPAHEEETPTETAPARTLIWERPEPEYQDSTMTLMVYMTGSDLESRAGAATSDLEEMANSGVDLSRVNLLVYTGGCERWYTDIPADENTILRLTEDGFQEMARYPELSMGEPESLLRLLNYGVENYPAERYGLIFWDHGNGPIMGYGKDTLHDGDRMTLPELREALAGSPFGAELRLDFVGFDACLMSSLELACTLEPYADYLVASQEVEPSFGWNYEFLPQCGYVTTPSLGAAIADSYLNYCHTYFGENPNFTSDVTLSCMRLSAAGETHDALDALFAKAAQNVSGDYNRLAVQRVNARALGRVTTGSEYDLVDLGSLMEQMGELYPQETAAVKAALDELLVCSGANTNGLCGLSLYYPYYNKGYYQRTWKDDYAQLSLLPRYRSYLDRFDQVWLGTDMRDFFSAPMSPEEFTPGTYSLRLTEEQAERYASGRYYVLKRYGEGIYSAVACSGDVTLEDGVLTANYTGKTIYLVNDYGDRSALLADEVYVQNGKTYYVIRYTMDTIYSMGDPDQEIGHYELVLALDNETQTLAVEGFYRLVEDTTGRGELQTGKKEFVDLEYWKVLNLQISRPRYPVRDDGGVLLPYEQWSVGDWIVMDRAAAADGIHFTYEPFYDDGLEYYLMFELTDVQGNAYSSEMMPIQVPKEPEREAEQYPEEKILWTSGSVSPSVEACGVELSLVSSRERDNGASVYGFRAINRNDIAVSVSIDNLLVNDVLQVVSGGTIWLDPGETEFYACDEIGAVLRQSGTDALQRLSFIIRLKRTVDFSWLHRGLRVEADLSAAPIYAPIPFMDARAEAQSLMEAEGVTVNLQSWGQAFTAKWLGSDLPVVLLLENHSDQVRYVELSGIRLNGLAFHLSESFTLPAGARMAVVKEQYIIDVESAMNGPIYSMDLRLSVGTEKLTYGESREFENAAWIPVTLAEAGEEQPAEYALLYEDDLIRAFDGGAVGTYSSVPMGLQRVLLLDPGDDWAYWKVMGILVDGLESEELEFGWGGTILPDALTPVSIGWRYGYGQPFFPEMTVQLRITNTEGEKFVQEITLPAWEGSDQP